MEKIDINQNVGELFCEEPFALRIRKVCGSHEIVSVRDLCLHTNHTCYTNQYTYQFFHIIIFH